jgi:hypothetical protein
MTSYAYPREHLRRSWTSLAVSSRGGASLAKVALSILTTDGPHNVFENVRREVGHLHELGTCASRQTPWRSLGLSHARPHGRQPFETPRLGPARASRRALLAPPAWARAAPERCGSAGSPRRRGVEPPRIATPRAPTGRASASCSRHPPRRWQRLLGGMTFGADPPSATRPARSLDAHRPGSSAGPLLARRPKVSTASLRPRARRRGSTRPPLARCRSCRSP